MAFGETRRHREEREARQSDLYPELELSGIDGVFAVDRLRREESRPLTSVGMAVEDAMVRSRPPVDPEEELGAQRGFFQPPPDPLPQPREPSLAPVERLPTPQQPRPAFEIGPNLEPLSIERTREELATTRPGLPREAALDLDERIRLAFGEDEDVSRFDFGDLFSELGMAEARLEELTSRKGAPLSLLEERDTRQRVQQLREATSLAGPLTESDRGGLAQLVGITLQQLAAIPGGEQVLRRLTVETMVATSDVTKAEAGKRFDVMWESWPRWLQLVAEETFDPTNALLVAGGAVLAPRLLASSSRTARVLGEVLKPISKGPLAFPSEVGAAVGLRGAFEASEGAPLPVRLALGAVGAVAGVGAVRGAPRALAPIPDLAQGVRRYGDEVLTTLRGSGPLQAGEAGLRAEIVPGVPDAFARAKAALRGALAEENALRESGQTAAEITRERARRFGNYIPTLRRMRAAGLSEEDAALATTFERGVMRSTFADPIQIDSAAREAMFAELGRLLDTGVIDVPRHRTLRDILTRALAGTGFNQPAQMRMLREFLGDDIAEAVLVRSSANQMLSVAARIGRGGRRGPGGATLPSSGGPGIPTGPRGVTSTGRGRGATPRPIGGVPTPVPPEPALGGVGVLERGPIRRSGGRLLPSGEATVPGGITDLPEGRGVRAQPRPLRVDPEPVVEPALTGLGVLERDFIRRGGATLPGGGGVDLPSGPRGVTSTGIRRGAQTVATKPLQQAVEVAESHNRLLENILDVWNIPRSLKSSFDVSAWLRQGGLLGAKNIDAWTAALGPSLRALRNPEEARIILDQIQNGPKALIRNRAGVFFAEITDPNLQVRRLGDRWAVVNRETDQQIGLFRTKAEAEARLLPKLTQREEQFISRIASKIPGVGASERSFVVFLNKLRADVFDKFAAELSARNAEWFEYEELARMVNVFTGRGSLPKGHGDIISLLGNTFWSMRLIVARFEAPLMLFSKSPLVRREAAYSLGAFVAERMAVLGLGAAFGLWTVELNPRSSDLGKIKLPGGVRIDPWGGFQQMVVFANRLASGQIATTGSGNLRDVDRWELAWNFIRGKLSPSAATAVNIKEGENIIGEPMTPASVVGDLTIPLTPQDFWDGYRFGGIPGSAIAGTAGVIGFGAQSFQSFGDLQAAVAADLFPDKSPDEPLNREERRQVNADPRMQERIGGFEDDSGTPEQQLSFAFDNLDRVKTDAEAELRAAIDAGATALVLKDAIKQLKETRFIAADALLGSDTLQAALERTDQPVEDVLAEAYWSIDLQIHPETGSKDFEARDEERVAILQEAAERGVDLNYIAGFGEGTYRGTRFADERVREMVEQYDTDVQAAVESGLFELRDLAWEDMQRSFPATVEFDSMFDWRDAEIAKLVAQEMPPTRAERAVQQHPFKEAFDANKNMREQQWVIANTPSGLAAKADLWDFFTPTNEELDIIESFPRQPVAATP
ncbi:hypothetical protein LCGC14_0391550 [marine sediment metagenome]|uniref:Large polyvalent protein associated domain-containing protein n=1 Tax=marine sediment metagenome TaxID=412755 RepID=A0A0F9T5B9_9ZZZZ